VRAIHEHDRGKKAEEICRDLGVSRGSFYAWKKQYAGLGIAELRELRQLREENGRPKRLVADLTLDRQILQEAATKKV
jgi:putative transposase